MKKLVFQIAPLLFVTVILAPVTGIAQKQTFDLVSYIPPKGWTKEIKESTGQFSVPNNWQVHFTKIENKARTYHAFWSCIKGARVLNLLPVEAPGSGIYTKYGLAK